jgi:ankyrin repeat protein
MDTLPLPPRPDLAQYRKRAKELVKVSGDSDAVRTWANEWLQTLERVRGDSVSPFVQGSFDRAVDLLDERARENITLADAQFLIARAHGFKGWRDFARHVERLSHEDGDTFESGADAVVGGELAALESLLRREPDLVHARSPREHRATLLHYVAANGVEDFRQLTPPNAVEVARMLLDAGADVDALAETYGGGSAQTTLNLLVSSAHPAEAGLQAALVDTLADHGAAINGLEDDASPLMTALAFGYVDTADSLVRRGARIDNVVAAAALGRSELVERMLSEGVKVAPSLVNLYWLGLSDDPSSQVERAREWAAAYGHTDVVRLLAERG